MKHPSEMFWQQYALTDELSREERERAEIHLYRCEACLELYTRSIAESGTSPMLSEEGAASLTAALRGHRDVMNTGARRRRRLTGPERRRTLIHYVIAASLTLFFLSSGLLQDYLDEMGQPVQGLAIAEDGQTITSRLMEQTTDLLRSWKPSAEAEE